MIADFPNIKKGTQWHQTSAAQWQNLVRAVHRLEGTTDENSRRLQNGFETIAQNRATVLIVRRPTDTDTSLTVRMVRFNTLTPRPDDYEWASAEFEAFPDFGSRAVDYAEFTATGAQPAIADTYLSAYRRDGAWLVQMPGEAGIALRVVTIDAIFANYIRCLDADNTVIYVALPPLLQPRIYTPRLEALGLTVVIADPLRLISYTVGITRFTETQSIMPSYRRGDIIVAGTLPADDIGLQAPGPPPSPIVWMDVNVDGRAWATIGVTTG